MKMKKTSEAKLVRQLRKTASARSDSDSGIILGIGDDAALLAPAPGHETIVTCDWFLEGTHFLRDKHPPDGVGWKCLARAVSDIAAMGGQPRCFLLSLALPESLTGRWFAQFLGGLARAAQKLQCPLAGGDTTRQERVLINVTVLGEVRERTAGLRSGARPGDIIYVSGRLGEAEFGFRLLMAGTSAGSYERAVKKHLYPEPRLALGQWLANSHLATSMMDLSDGLSTDLDRLCRASSVGAQIQASQIPAVEGPKRNEASKPKKDDALTRALNGGDDYELLFTVRATKAGRLPSSFKGIPLTPIGQITRTRAILLVQSDGRTKRLRPSGWDPFRH